MPFVLRNRVALAAVILMITIGLALPIAFLKLEWSFKDLASSRSSETSAYYRHHHNRPRVLRSQVTKSGTRYTAFVYKSCAETFSFGYTWFTTEAFDVVCDTLDKSPLCTVNIENSRGYEYLGEKSLNLWKLVHNSPDSEEIIVKIDDDTLIQKHVMDEFVDNFARNKKCELTGIMHAWAPEFYWPLGRLYMFKKRALPPTGHLRWSNATFFNKFEDAQIGYLLGANDKDKICDLDSDKFWHTGFKDGRVEINFKPLFASCEQHSTTEEGSNTLEQAPKTESDTQEQVPKTEPDTQEQVPKTESNTPEQAPKTESNTQEQVPKTESNTQEQAPKTESNTQEQLPKTESNTQEQVPMTESNTQEQAPKTESNTQGQVPKSN